MPTDAELIKATLQGDSAAYGQLVRAHEDRLFNTLFRISGCQQEAEDVAQESFLQAFLKLDSFRGNSRFYTWLYRIAFNIYATRRRKQRPQQSWEQIRGQTGAEPLDGRESAGDALERKEEVRLIHQALAELSPEYREILILRELEDCNYETISEILDIPTGTVRSRLHRARLQLRDIIDRPQQPSKKR